MRVWGVVFLYLAVVQLSNAEISDDISAEEQSSVSVEQKLMSTRKVLISRLDRCTLWREDIDTEERNMLQRLLVRAEFEKFREKALKIAQRSFPEDEDCLRSVQFLIRKYNRVSDLNKRYLGSENSGHIEEFLSPRQLNGLHSIYKETGRKEDIQNALIRFFDGMSERRIEQLLNEFFDYKPDLRRRPRQVDTEEVKEKKTTVSPSKLKEEWLTWMSPTHKERIARLNSSGADQWEVMNRIADQFYHLRKDVRREHATNLEAYCISNLKKVIGINNMNAIESMYLDHDPVDQMETRFHVMVADLPNESDRMLADHYASFCRKIFRLVHFEPADMTSWLKDSQKLQLKDLIQNPEIGDLKVYEKVFEFFEEAKGEEKEEARNIIDTGCTEFIAHMFGDDAAEELEDLRLMGNVSSQQLAAKLAHHAKQVSSEKLRRRAEQSLPMCVRIYLGYENTCDCHGHADTCDETTHMCINCAGNTTGVQCESCLEGFEGDALADVCTPIEMENEESRTSSCNCNQHSAECTKDGACKNCQHNTEGDRCERCRPGYYGVAVTGSPDDCSVCPCPNRGSCFVNKDSLVQCNSCPDGWQGVTCGKKIEKKDKSSEQEESFFFF